MNKILITLLGLLVFSITLKSQTITMPGCEPVWRYSVTGSGIGVNRMQCHDYDGDGNVELIIGVHNLDMYGCSYWYKMEYNPVTGGFDQKWVSSFNGYDDEAPTVFESFDCDNDGSFEILAGYSNSKVEVYDPVTMQREAVFEIPSWDEEEIFRIIKADADNDGEEEIVCCTNNATYLIHAGSYAYDTKFWYGARNMRCGNVDSDPALELVYTDGSVVRVTNGIAELLWDFAAPTYYPRKLIELYDLDSDGMQEILFVDTDLLVYDADTQTEKFRIDKSSDYDINDILFADTQTGNGIELILGADDGPEFYTLEGVFNRELYDYGLSGTVGMNIADLNDDGINELLFTSGYYSSSEDYLNVYNFQTNEITWQSRKFEGPFYCLKVSDADNDGNNELIFLNDDYNSVMSFMDSFTRKIEWLTFPESYYFGQTKHFDIADFDNDGDKEIVQITGDYSGSKVSTVNARTHVTESSHEFTTYSFSKIKIADADLDGMHDFILCNNDYLYIVNPADYSIVWNSPLEWVSEYGSSGKTVIETGNTDHDANVEIIWYTGGSLFVVDGFTKQLEMYVENIRDFFLYDLEKDGISEIFYCEWVSGVWASNVGYFNGESGEKILLKIANTDIDEMVLFDVPGRTQPVMAGIGTGMITFMTIDSSGTTEPYRVTSNTYNDNPDDLIVTDYNNDGISELLVLTNEMIIEFDVSCYLPLSMNEPADIQSLKVWPNPAGDIISFRTQQMQGEATIINIQGQVVMKIPAGAATADVGMLSPGLYLLKVISGNQHYITRFLKQ